MTAVSSNGVGLVNMDNVGKDELGPTHFALVVLVGRDQSSRVRVSFAGTSRSSRYLSQPREIRSHRQSWTTTKSLILARFGMAGRANIVPALLTQRE